MPVAVPPTADCGVRGSAAPALCGAGVAVSELAAMPLDRVGQGKPPPTTATKPAPASPAATEVHAEHFRVALGLFFWVLLKSPGALSAQRALHAEHRIAERRRTLPDWNDGAREHGTARRSGLVAGNNQMAVCCRHTRVYRCQSAAFGRHRLPAQYESIVPPATAVSLPPLLAAHDEL